MKQLLLLAVFLSGCAVSIPSELPVPTRAPMLPVNLQTVGEDGTCPGGGYYYMDEEAFIALQKDVLNTEAYIKQLEELLKSVQGEQK